MNYIKLPYMDSPVSTYDICHAHQMLESNYNRGGMLWERPSNKRRNESTGCQLLRMKYHDVRRVVDLFGDDGEDEDVRDIYLVNVMKWKLPMDSGMQELVRRRYTADFLARFGL